MHNFHYAAPKSLIECTRLLSEHQGKVALLAGGTDLIVAMRKGLKRPDVVIDVKHIPELKELFMSEAELKLGASVSCRSIYENKSVVERLPILGDCTKLIGSKQVQGRASVGGNLCNAAPSGDAIPALIVLKAVACIQNVTGIRELSVGNFCTSPMKTVLEGDELLTRIVIPLPNKSSNAMFLRFIPRKEMDIAIANAASAVTLSEDFGEFISARIAIGSVAPTPILVEEAADYLIGKPVTDKHIDVAAEIAKKLAKPINDMRGTIAQRKDLVEVLTRRTLQGAVNRVRRHV